ncbi:hypothetical protein CsSME_00022099 [Camellia sinensis var. sinensis]
MSKENVRRHVLEKNRSPREKEKTNNGFLSKHLKKVYPISLHKSISTLSLSSLSLSLSQNSNDSSLTDSTISLDQKISLALRLIAPPERRDVPVLAKNVQQHSPSPTGEGMKRCNWITKNSDKTYVQFHDDCWGVPVYDDNELFELLAMSSMLMDYNWTEILKRKELFR